MPMNRDGSWRGGSDDWRVRDRGRTEDERFAPREGAGEWSPQTDWNVDERHQPDWRERRYGEGSYAREPGWDEDRRGARGGYGGMGQTGHGPREYGGEWGGRGSRGPYEYGGYGARGGGSGYRAHDEWGRRGYFEGEFGAGVRDEEWRGEPPRRDYGGRGFVARGPKGYVRSDERIRDDVCDRLMATHWIDTSDVEVTVRACEVSLAGTVPHREDKRRIEDLCESVLGVREVHNGLRVQQRGYGEPVTPTPSGNGSNKPRA